MVGGQTCPGIIPHTFLELFDSAERQGLHNLVLRVCLVEVYNETVRDLLTVDQTTVEIREDTGGRQTIKGASEVLVKTVSEIMMVIK